jgi:hypothetical protein
MKIEIINDREAAMCKRNKRKSFYCNRNILSLSAQHNIITQTGMLCITYKQILSKYDELQLVQQLRVASC